MDQVLNVQQTHVKLMPIVLMPVQVHVVIVIRRQNVVKMQVLVHPVLLHVFEMEVVCKIAAALNVQVKA